MFLNQNKCGKIKGICCAEGIKQRKYLTKDKASAPTVLIESLFLTCLIDATEHCHVETVDMPGAFMQAEMEDETAHMKME